MATAPACSGMCNTKQTRPQITDYATPHAGFSCEIRLPAELGIPGIEDRVFGDKHRSFKNKRSAKIAASKDAVLWIREQNAAVSTAYTLGGRAQPTQAMGTGSIDIIDNTPPAQVVNSKYLVALFSSFSFFFVGRGLS